MDSIDGFYMLSARSAEKIFGLVGVRDPKSWIPIWIQAWIQSWMQSLIQSLIQSGSTGPRVHEPKKWTPLERFGRKSKNLERNHHF